MGALRSHSFADRGSGRGDAMTFGVVLFIIAILVVVMIHESGHFFTAKYFNFKATQYFLGFGPTIWSTQRGETEYGIKALPLGGFVKIIGMNPYEDIPEEDLPRSYPNKPAWQRAIVLVAGSATHWVVAFLLLTFAFSAIGYPTGNATTTIQDITSSLDGEDTPAGDGALSPGDEIVGIEGVADGGADTWAEIRAHIQAHPGETVTFVIERDGNTRTEAIELGTGLFDADGAIVDYAPPDEDVRTPSEGETVGGFLGVSPEPEYKRDSVTGAIKRGGSETWQLTYLSFKGIGIVFGTVFDSDFWAQVSGSEERDPRGALGLVGAGKIAGETVQRGQYLDLIGMIAAFTVFIGLMNLLPLPPLDGGHLAILAFEKITGRKVDIRKTIPVAAAVISFFVVLFLAVLYLDIAHPIQTPF
jgi:membrane-associated protease RseP (regulator of RpoE activity)